MVTAFWVVVAVLFVLGYAGAGVAMWVDVRAADGGSRARAAVVRALVATSGSALVAMVLLLVVAALAGLVEVLR